MGVAIVGDGIGLGAEGSPIVGMTHKPVGHGELFGGVGAGFPKDKEVKPGLPMLNNSVQVWGLWVLGL